MRFHSWNDVGDFTCALIDWIAVGKLGKFPMARSYKIIVGSKIMNESEPLNRMWVGLTWQTSKDYRLIDLGSLSL